MYIAVYDCSRKPIDHLRYVHPYTLYGVITLAYELLFKYNS